MTTTKVIFETEVVKPFKVLVESLAKNVVVGYITSSDNTLMVISVDNIKNKKELSLILDTYKNTFGKLPIVHTRQGLKKRPYYYLQLVRSLV
jgi:hypothetical protein